MHESKKIIVTEKSSLYKAILAGKPEVWGTGKSQKEAIGDLVNSHLDEFNIEVECE